MSIDSEKNIIKQYGQVIEFINLKDEDIESQTVDGYEIYPISLIKKSDIEKFRNSIINQYGTVETTGSQDYNTSKISYIKKHTTYLEVSLNVEGHHFILDNILKDDILFLYKTKDNKCFIIVQDECITEILNSEHAVFGMIDFSEGKTLLLKKDKDIKQKMKIFQKKIETLAVKYYDILFITISDSIVIKYSFKVVTEENTFQPDKLDFFKIIEIFKELRQLILQIFQMNVYGIFTYGKNKGITSQSILKNVFHTGILSREFEKMINMETTVRNTLKNQPHIQKGDIYLSRVLYKAFRHHLRKKYQSSPILIEPSTRQWGIRDSDIVAMIIPNKALTLKKKSIDFQNSTCT